MSDSDEWTEIRSCENEDLIKLMKEMQQDIKALQAEIRQLGGHIKQHQSLLTLPLLSGDALDTQRMQNERAVNRAIRQGTPIPVAKSIRP